MERTLAIIKPDAVQKKITGKIISQIRKNFKIAAIKQVYMTREEASAFYREHKGKTFFPELVNFMSSGPCIVIVLEGENVVEKWRKFIGNRDPSRAEEGTIRKLYGEVLPKNAVHGSDSSASAVREIEFFFGKKMQHIKY